MAESKVWGGSISMMSKIEIDNERAFMCRKMGMIAMTKL